MRLGVLAAIALSTVGTPTVRVTVTDASLRVAPERVPAGTLRIRVLNRGRKTRTVALAGARAVVPAGGAATLRIALAHRGPRTIAATGPRRRQRLTGVLNVFEPCTRPAATTVAVRMDHDRTGITLSQPAIPCGTVTFVVTNAGVLVDSLQVFAGYPRASGATPTLKPGQTARITVRFTEKGRAYYQSGEYPPGEPEFGGSDADGGLLAIT